MGPTIYVVGAVLLAVALYLYHVNQGMSIIPAESARISGKRWTKADVLAAVDRLKTPPDITDYLPTRQGRRYIVAGGSGLVGGWIVKLLLQRGEDPHAIRIVDLWPPKQSFLKEKPIGFCFGDVADPKSLRAAFQASWPAEHKGKPLCVFSTVAIIRYWERQWDQVPLSAKVNVEGTRNTIAAAKAAKADIFIWTSSASVSVQNIHYWIPPWKSHPDNLVQEHDERNPKTDKRFHEYANNYCYTKALGERIVRESDDPASGFHTGCIRPANVVFGEGDLSATACLKLGGAPSWYASCLAPLVSVENVSLAHLCYEKQLADPLCKMEVSGEVFNAGDPNAPIAYGDMYLLLDTLTDGKVRHPSVPPILFLIIAYIVEFYELIRRRYLPILPRVGGNLIFCQPGMFSVSCAHLRFDDSRARLAPEKGGLGYRSPWTTLDGMVQVTLDYLANAPEKVALSPYQLALAKMEAKPDRISL